MRSILAEILTNNSIHACSDTTKILHSSIMSYRSFASFLLHISFGYFFDCSFLPLIICSGLFVHSQYIFQFITNAILIESPSGYCCGIQKSLICSYSILLVQRSSLTNETLRRQLDGNKKYCYKYVNETYSLTYYALDSLILITYLL